MELSPHWEIEYEGSDEPKHTAYLHEAQKFVAEHEIISILFYVHVMFGPKDGIERKYGKQQLTKEEMPRLTQDWLTSRKQKRG
jgi:hypothetical protein